VKLTVKARISETLTEKGLLSKTIIRSSVSFLDNFPSYHITDAGRAALKGY